MINTTNHGDGNSNNEGARVKKNLKLTVHSSSDVTQPEGCAGDPINEACPLHNIYRLIDPNFQGYSALDCSVVVYDVQRMLADSDDPVLVEQITKELQECPSCVDLLDMEGRLRSMIHNACCQDAPVELRGRIKDMLQTLARGEGDSCCGGEDTDNTCENLLEEILDSTNDRDSDPSDES